MRRSRAPEGKAPDALGPFVGQGVCTFCGCTDDVYCYPSPRAELEKLGFDMTKVQTAETHHCSCIQCCGAQEDGHEYSYCQGEGWSCERCGQEPPSDFFCGIEE